MMHIPRVLRAVSVSLAAALFLPGLPVLAQEAASPQSVARETRCPVCGMYPARYPKWMAQIAFTDRTTQAFDSPAELFRFLEDMAKYDKKHTRSDVAAIFLSDYARGGWIEGKRAFFVAGSSARGPMNNPDLPAFGSLDAAEQFARSNGGKVLGFGQVAPEALKEPENSGHDHAHHGH